MSHPRSVVILANGATDIWNNNNTASITSAISYDDTTPPALQSAAYSTSGGQLSIVLSERLALHDPSKIILYDSTKAGNVTLSSNTFTQNPAGSLTTTLTGSVKASFVNLTHPRHVAILTDGAADIWNNNNTASITSAISYDDATPPALQSAAYSTSGGQLSIVLSERLALHDPSKIILYDSTKAGNVTLSSNTFTQNPFGTLTATLSGSQMTSFVGLDNPRYVAVRPGGVTDVWNNANPSHLATTVSYSDPNNMTITSAAYNTISGFLNVTLSEDSFEHDSTKIILHDSTKNVTFGASALAENTAGILTATLTGNSKIGFEALKHPRNVTILPGGIADVWNRTNAAPLTHAVSYDDTAPPTISAAEYATATGQLNVTLSEDIAAFDPADITLYDSTKTGNVTFQSGAFTESPAGTLVTTLSGTSKTAFEDLSHPRSVAIRSGGVTDIWNNANAAPLTHAVSYDDTAPPALQSAAYSTSGGTLNITLSERLALYDPSKITLYDPTKAGNVTLASNTINQHSPGTLTVNLTGAQMTSLAGMTNPRYVAILAGGATDIWNNTNPSHLSVTISYSDPSIMTITSATYNTTSGFLNVTLSGDSIRHDSTKIILHDSAKNVTLGPGSFAENAPGMLTVTMSGGNKTAFENLSHPRKVSILAGGTYDIWNRTNAAPLSLHISYTDAIPPTLSSARYASSTGVLTLALSERLTLSGSSSVILYDDTKSGNLTVSSGKLSQSSPGTLAASLDTNTKKSFEDSLSHPRHVAILPGNVSDIWNNANSATLTAAVLPEVSATPDMVSAVYDPSAGSLKLEFSENLASYNSTKIVLYNSTKTGNITFNSGAFTEKVPGLLNSTLSNQQQSTFKNWIFPRNVTVFANALVDIWDSSNPADLAHTISYPTVTKPYIKNATYIADNGTLTVNFSTQLESTAIDMSLVHVRATQAPGYPTDVYRLYNDLILVNGTNYVKLALSKNSTIYKFTSSLDPVNILLDSGAVQGKWNNKISSSWFWNTVTTDNYPTLLSVAHYPHNATLALQFSEYLDTSVIDAGKFNVYNEVAPGRGLTLNGINMTYRDGGSITFHLSSSTNTEINNFYPAKLNVGKGAVADVSGNKIKAASGFSVTVPGRNVTELSGALFNPTTGNLDLTFTVSVESVDASKIVLHDSSGTGNVTFTSGDFSIDFLKVSSLLNDNQKSMFEDLRHPRNITLLDGSVTDIWSNDMGHTTFFVSSTDNSSPTVSSAKYATATGQLNITLSEDIAAFDPADITLYDSTKTGNVTFQSGDFAEIAPGILSTNLTGSDMTSFEDLAHPRSVAIQSGGITDIWGNSNGAHLASAVSDDDTTPPGISAVNYATATGQLNITLSEDIAAFDPADITLYDSTKTGNVTFQSGDFAEIAPGILSTNLTGSDLASFLDLNHPRSVAIQSGGITDIWGNSNGAHLASAVSDDDTTPPGISAVNYATATGQLNITLSEDIAAFDPADITLYDSTKTGNVTFQSGDFAEIAPGVLSANLTGSDLASFRDLGHPRNVTIQSGGVTDIWGNPTAAHLASAVSDDDTTPPGISAVNYATATGQLNITLSEDIAAFDPADITLYDSTKTGNVTFQSGDFAEIAPGVLSANLTGSDLASFLDLNHPRSVAIQSGGVTDIWGNSNGAHLASAVSDDDTTPPGISAVNYATATGQLNITLSEDIAAFDPADITLYDSTKTGNVTFQSGDFAEIAPGILSTNLTGSDMTSFEDLAHPRSVAIQSGGITDIWNNSNHAPLTSHIVAGDVAPQTISSAEYATATGQLNITLSEDIAAFDPADITLYDSTKTGNVTFQSGDFAEIAPGILSANLTGSDLASFLDLNHPRSVAIQSGGITDIWGNSNGAHLASAVSDDDTTPPGISAVNYATATGQLNITLSEDIAAFDPADITLYDSTKTGNVTFQSGDFAEIAPGILSTNLTGSDMTSFEDLAHPRSVAIQSGGITDIWGNSNGAHLASAVSDDDTTPPGISAVNYATATGQLNITLSEDIAAFDPADITLYDSTKTGNVTFQSGDFAEIAPGILSTNLTGSDMTSFEDLAHPRSVAIQSGGITDIWGNSNGATLVMAISYDVSPPTISSAEYATATGQLNITLSEDIAAFDPADITLYDSTKTGNVTFQSGDFAEIAPGILSTNLTGSDMTSFEDLAHPRNVTIQSGGVTDIWNSSNHAPLTSRIVAGDVAPPTISSAEYATATGQLNITLSEDIAAFDPADITLYDSTKTGNVTFQSGDFAEIAPGILSTNLTGSDLASFRDLGHPRNVTIQSGGITGIWGNANVATLVMAISYDDVSPPTISSAEYATAIGQLNITLSEDITAFDPADITLYDSTKTGNVTFQSGDFAEIAPGILSANLTGSDLASFLDLNHPRSVAIQSGGITDIWGNSNGAHLASAVSDDDTTPPGISAVNYATATGQLNITLSEDIAAFDPADITLYDSTKTGNVTFQSGDFAEIAPGILSANLTGSDLASFRDLEHPRNVTIQSGGVTDIWGNSNGAHLASAVSDDDTTPPGISAVNYATATGQLNITLSEDIAAFDPADITLYDSTKTGNVTFQSGDFAEIAPGILSTNLTGSDMTSFEDLAHPRNVTIQSGGITDIWGNANSASLTSRITTIDTAPFALRSATYNTTSGALTLTLSEDIAAYDATDITLYDSTKTGNVTFQSGDFAEIAPGTLSVNLTGSDLASFRDLGHPRNVTIQSGGVTDIWGNSNGATLAMAISYDDVSPPTISSAKYATATGQLNITLSEDIAAFDPADITLYDSTKTGNVTFQSGDFAEIAPGILSTNLTGSDLASFRDLGHPRNVTIQSGGVTDIWGNPTAAHLASAVSDDDTTPPGISAVNYATATGQLNITLSEDIAAFDPADITLYDSTKTGNVTFRSGDFAEIAPGVLSANLTGSDLASFRDLGHPRNVTIQSGGVTDIWGNSNGATLAMAISYDDVSPPTISSAKYATATGQLNITLSEDIAAFDPADITLYDSTKTGNVTFQSGDFAEIAPGILSTNLTGSDMTSFEDLAHPRNVTIQSGGITDIWGNSNGAHLASAVSDDDTTPPGISAVNYATATGQLNITLSEDIAAFDPADITLYDSTKTGNVTFRSGDFAEIAPGILSTNLTGSDLASFLDLNHPRSVAIQSGGITDIWGNSNGAHLASAVSDDDTTPPGISAVNYATATGQLNITLSEDIAAFDPADITLYDSTKTGNVTFQSGAFTENPAGTLVTTLSGTSKTAFEDLNHPRNVTIQSGGITDIWGNANGAPLGMAVSYDDTAPPTIYSAAYNPIAGIISVVFSENLADHDSTDIVLHDSTKTGNVTFQSGDFAEIAPGVLSANLTGSDLTSFQNLSHPRNVTIHSGGVTDLWNNPNPAPLTSYIVAGDTAPPTISSAEYATATGQLNITLSEDIAAFDPADITLYDSTKTGNVTFQSGAFTENPAGTLVTTLSGTSKTAFEDLNHPRSVAIQSGGITDIWGNTNGAPLGMAVSYDDDTPPTISSAEYATATGQLNITLSEDIAAFDPADITLYDSTKTGNVTFRSGDFAEIAPGILSTNLTGSDMTSFEDLAHPRSVAIQSGGITDIWDNPAAVHLAAPISYDDDAPPTISSAEYATATGQLNITLSEDIAAFDPADITLYDSTKTGNVTFQSGDFAEIAPGILSTNLTGSDMTSFEDLAHPRSVAIQSGGITDIWDNPTAVHLAAPISYDDDTPPTISSAEYATATGQLNITLSEDIAAFDPADITLYDSTKTGNVTFQSGDFAEIAPGILSTNLTGSDMTSFEDLAHPRSVAIQSGGITDIWDNPTAVHLAAPISYDDDTPPTISSAEYATATGQLNITLSEDIAAFDPADITLYDSTKTGNVTFRSGDFAEIAPGILSTNLTGSDMTSFEDLAHPRSVAIQSGGITDIWDNPTAVHLAAPISYDDDTPPTISSAEYATATGQLNITLSEDIAAFDPADITLYDSTKTGNVTFRSGDFAEIAPGILSTNLTGSDMTSFEDLAHPRNVTIQSGGITDIWDNPTAVHLAAPISYDDDAPPIFSSAVYDASTGLLRLTLTEDLGTYDSTKMVLHDSSGTGNVTFSVAAFTESAPGTLTATLSGSNRTAFENMSHPRNVTILHGGVTDIWGNAAQITSVVSGDVVPPKLSAATYYTGNSTIFLEFSELLSTHESSRIALHNSSKTGNVTFASGAFNRTDSVLVAALDDQMRQSFEGMSAPRYVSVSPGGVTDRWDNANTDTLAAAITITDTTPPALLSAAYSTGGAATLTFSEALETAAATGLRISDGSGNTAAFYRATVSGNATTALLDPADVPVFGAPGITLHIGAGSVTDRAGNPVSAISVTNITITDDSPPVFVNGTYRTGGVLELAFNEPIGSADPARITLGGDSDTLTLSGAAQTSGNTVTHVLGDEDAALLRDSPYVTLDLGSGAVTDASDNPIKAATGMYLNVLDTARPLIADAAYYTGSGILSLKFGEAIGSADTTQVSLSDAASTAVLPSNHTVSANILTSALSDADRVKFANSPALNVTVAEGAVADESGNGIAAVQAHPVKVLSPGRPVLVDSAYYTGNGTLVMTFSERIVSANISQITVQSGSIRVDVSGTGSAHYAGSGITTQALDVQTGGEDLRRAAAQGMLGGAAATDPVISANTVTAVLNEAARARLAGSGDVSLEIGQGAVTGVSGDMDQVTSSDVFVSDTTKPAFVAATYDPASGILTLTFSETVGSANPNGLTVRDGSTSVAPSRIPAISGAGVAVQMSGAEKSALAGSADISLDLDAGSVADTSGNRNDAAVNLPVAVLRPGAPAAPAAPPGFLGLFPFALPPADQPLLSVTFDGAPEALRASYDAAAGTLSVTFDEIIDPDTINPEGFELVAQSGASLRPDGFAPERSRTVTADMPGSVTMSDVLVLRLGADAVRDGSGNGNPASNLTARIYDSAAPLVRSAVYVPALGMLGITFDRDISGADPALFRMDNASLRDAAVLDVQSGNTVYLVLDGPLRDSVDPSPRLYMEYGAATGDDGAPSWPVWDHPITLGTSPDADFIRSAIYDSVSGTLWLDVEGSAASANYSRVTLGTVPLSEMRVALNGVLVSAGNSTVSGTPYLNVPDGAITTAYGAVPAVRNHTVHTFDGITADVVSETDVGNATATRIMPHPNGTTYAVSAVPGGISVFDITDPANPGPVHRVRTGGDVLDMGHLAADGSAYILALNDTSVLLYDTADPGVPAGSVPHGARLDSGSVSVVTLEGVEYGVLVAGDRVAAVLLSDPSSPKIVLAAKIREAAEGSAGSAPAGDGRVAAALRPGHLCMLDVNDTAALAADCREYALGNPGPMSYADVRGVSWIAAAGDGPGVSIHNASLGVVASAATSQTPRDVGVASVYGIAYALVAAPGNLTIYDIDGGMAPVLVVPDSYVSLDVAEFGGSTYAALTGSDGRVYIMDLARVR